MKIFKKTSDKKVTMVPMKILFFAKGYLKHQKNSKLTLKITSMKTRQIFVNKETTFILIIKKIYTLKKSK